MIILPFALALVAAGAAYPKHAREIVAEVRADFDDDGGDELAVVERVSKSRLRVLILDVIREGDTVSYRTRLETDPRAADRVARFEAKNVGGGPEPELVAVLEELSPDETLAHVRILGKGADGLGELLAQTFLLGKPKQNGLLSFGDATPRVSFVQNTQGQTEVVWVREPEILELARGPEPAKVVIGSRAQVFRYRPGQGRFLPDEVLRNEDFMPAKSPWSVDATVQVPKIWGTAQAFWAADGDLATSWSIYSDTPDRDQSLSILFKAPESVALVRFVAGCARDRDSWQTHDRIRALTLTFSGGRKVSVDTAKLDAKIKGVRAVGEFPLEGGQGVQVLLLLDEPEEAKWVRVTVDDIERSSASKAQRVPEACLSEISFHGAQ